MLDPIEYDHWNVSHHEIKLSHPYYDAHVNEISIISRNTDNCDTLSRQAQVLWAKTDRDNPEKWLPLYQHMLDSGEVARLIWREWLPSSIRRQISEFAGSDTAGETLVTWLAAVHDLGKATPGFQYKNDALANKVRDQGLSLPDPRPTTPPFHALMSQALLARWLEEAHGWSKPTALTYAIVPGGHHGAPPNEGDLEALLGRPIKDEGLGGSNWRLVQNELADWVAGESGITSLLPILAQRSLPPTWQMLITGVVIMADWIASNTDYFPLFPLETLPSAVDRARQGWDQVHLPNAWVADPDIPDSELLFHQRFTDLPIDAKLRPAQAAMVDAATGLSSPGLIILEAPMGAGKTEAALLAAEILAAQFGQGGLAFLLPTMATSNAMFQRVLEWLTHVPAQGSQSLNLVHGKAALNDTFEEIRWQTTNMGDAADDALVAPAWLKGRKQSLLSSFVVGTVDQLLMAGLKAKHVVLRHLGLAGKVVVIDEVHAYDAYMSTYLDRVLSWLGAYQVPVILLSATLPPSRRAEMLQAYSTQGGEPAAISAAPRTAEGAPAYPLISIVDDTGVRYTTCVDDSSRQEIVLEEFPDDDVALLDHLTVALAGGGCVGIIRDTVTRAQATYEAARARFGDDVLLVHSRFIASDRITNDQRLLDLLGPKARSRPQRLIVVGTQVLEQSLDVDFDLMVTDVAPIDLLLQRLGRLHRHSMRDPGRPVALRQARCLLVGVSDWRATPPTLNDGVAKIYESAMLWRTIACLRALVAPNGIELHLPADIAPLVETVYQWDEDRFAVPDGWGEALAVTTQEMERRIEEKAAHAGDFLLGPVPRRRSVTGLLATKMHNADDDSQRGQATVRDSTDSIEVVTVQRTIDGVIRLLPWVIDTPPDGVAHKMSLLSSTLRSMDDPLQGRTLATLTEPDRHSARLAARCTVSLPFAMNQPWVILDVIKALEQQGSFEGWQASPWLRGVLPLVLDENLNASIVTSSGKTFRLHYDPMVGLQLLKESDHD
ncbi:MAG: CRISPR-associated helicase Cas3' [Propionibacteriaceae bacterium]|jgi:CRISPR-associated endonuclease/helicase Cas3|nr:CRISPR-associated helicase Cas3' [Propionibacteriaceae bacterium]